ncbi:hypothetical protein EJ08DRAFT_656842 [Tothia fuscella]|uniref:Tc1-like transposase DDE domain-containing protein n=1 Tax=Tothia fuscella TaxID=1048955 RepID=A0A9P4U3N8_9PEZI|nr:hypothetical protein EJ08DRAFT_656842 [Tothia fuscella]
MARKTRAKPSPAIGSIFGSPTRYTSSPLSFRISQNVKIYVALGVSYNHKEPLIFYKDPAEPSAPKPYKPRKPRKSLVQTEEEYTKAIDEFTRQSAGVEVLPKGNAMTQKFYAEQILPKHIDEIRMLEERYSHRFQLQEDGDPSHGNRSKNNLPAKLKRNSDLLLVIHPPQSPDLNPIEAV